MTAAKPRAQFLPSSLNPRVRGAKTSATIAIQQRCRDLRAAGREVFMLGLGQSPFPVPASVVDELKKNAFQKDYLPVKGLPSLRAAIAEHHRRVYGIDCTAEDVIIGPGSKELMFILQLAYNGDLVLPTPSWVSYEPQANIIGRRAHKLPTRREDNWKIMPDDLRALCAEDPGRPRLLILNYPANPGGGTYGPGELEAIAEAAREHNVLLLSDEIYGKLNFFANHRSIAPLYPEGTIFSGGLSKWCGAGGWRLGFFIFPANLRWLLDAMAVVASETYTSTSAPIQFAAVRAFADDPELERYLGRCRRVLKALGNHIADRLKDAGAEVVRPLGGFYLFPDLTPLAEPLARRGIRTSRELCARLLEETGVAVLPGSDFGRPPEELTLRLAYVDFDGGAAIASVESLREDQPVPLSFLERSCGPTVAAADRLCAWLKG